MRPITMMQSQWKAKGSIDVQVGDILTISDNNHYNKKLDWRVVNIDSDGVATLETKYVYNSTNGTNPQMEFDAAEAFYYAAEVLAAGTYNFTVANQLWYTADNGKTYQFTLVNSVPAGGQLVLSMTYNATLNGKKIMSYASSASTDPIETVTLTEGNSGTSLGRTDGTGNMNYMHRAIFGSNNYAQSAIRQWLTSAAAAASGSVWKPTNKFDRSPSWATNKNGFMHGLPANFLAAVQPSVLPCRTNSVFEVESLDGTLFSINQTYNVKDKFFLLSRPEIFGTYDSTSYKDGELLEYYDGLTQAQRIKTNTAGSARICWLRSPAPSRADGERLVSTDGSVSSSSAYTSYGVAPACKINLDNIQLLILSGTMTTDRAKSTSFQFENCKGGYFSVINDYGLRVTGKTAQDGNPTPDSPIEIRCVKAGTKIKCCGKNLFDKTAMVSDTASAFTVVSPGKTYIGSGLVSSAEMYQVRLYDVNFKQTRVLADPLGKKFLSFTAQAGECYTRIYTRTPDVCQLEYGTVATEYEPYIGNEITVPCDLYEGDIWYPMTGKVIRNSFHYAFTGSEILYIGDLATYHSGGTTDAYSINLINGINWNSTNHIPMSNRLVYKNWIWSLSGAIGVCLNAAQVHIRIPDSVTGIYENETQQNCINKIKAWLKSLYNAGDPLVVVAPRIIPVIEQYDPQPIFAPQGTVNVIQTPVDLSAELSATMIVRR